MFGMTAILLLKPLILCSTYVLKDTFYQKCIYMKKKHPYELTM